MREVGIDITDQQPKVLDYDTARQSDVIITMGCGDTCPYFPGKHYEDWNWTTPPTNRSIPYAASATTSAPASTRSSPN